MTSRVGVLKIMGPASSFGLLVLSALSGYAVAGPFDFSDQDVNDMRGAWSMCKTQFFSGSACPEIHYRCWKPPFIFLRRHKGHFHVDTECDQDASYDTSEESVNYALDYAANNTIEPEAYDSNEAGELDENLTPQICYDMPELCLTPEQEDDLANNNDPTGGGDSPFEDNEPLPPICEDNPELCDNAEDGALVDASVVVDVETANVLDLREREHYYDETYEGESNNLYSLPPICIDNPGLCEEAREY